MKAWLTIISLVFVANVYASSGKEQSLMEVLSELDETISQKQQYVSEKQKRIMDLKRDAESTSDMAKRYDCFLKLLNEYRNFNTDSAFYYADARYQLGQITGSTQWTNDAILNQADVYSLSGMYVDAMLKLKELDFRKLDAVQQMDYYRIKGQTFELLADYALQQKDRDRYIKEKLAYRDSMVQMVETGSPFYYILKADGWMEENTHIEELTEAMRKLDSQDDDLHGKALANYFLSLLSERKGDGEAQRLQLAKSAIADIKVGVRDYISLRRLAELLYKDGDLDRAFAYLTCSLEDAGSGNFRLRTLEVNKIFPIVNEAYVQRDAQQKRQLIYILLLVIAFTLTVAGGYFYLRRQNRKLNAMRLSLKEANDDLSRANAQLGDAISALKESNDIKEEYIGRYMSMCADYISRMEETKKNLLKTGKSRNMDELLASIKDSVSGEKEMKEFFHNFDTTFLSLFPNFIDDFNQLLQEDSRLQAKANGDLTTELRVFALIRLGVTDSAKIALFLRCSLSTIYNYRVKNRNAALDDRDRFEEKVMIIGR